MTTWPPHHHFPHFMPAVPHAADSPDTWLNLALGLAAITTILAFLAAAFAAARYGRRASVSISAEAHTLADQSVIIACRPTVRAVGILRVKFRDKEGSMAKVTELYRTAEGKIDEARTWQQPDVFGEMIAEPGEELPTSVIFQVGIPPASVIGWRASISVHATQNRMIPTWVWADRVFVPR